MAREDMDHEYDRYGDEVDCILDPRRRSYGCERVFSRLTRNIATSYTILDCQIKGLIVGAFQMG